MFDYESSFSPWDFRQTAKGGHIYINVHNYLWSLIDKVVLECFVTVVLATVRIAMHKDSPWVPGLTWRMVCGSNSSHVVFMIYTGCGK